MKETTKKNSNQVISDFLNSNKKVLLIILAVVVLSIAAFGLISAIRQTKINLMTNSTIELDVLYNNALQENNADVFISFAEFIAEEFEGQNAELFAYSRLASFYFDIEEFENSFTYYNMAYTKFPNDLAASVYMFNAAMAQEQLGSVDEAIVILQSLVEKYKSDNIDVADKSADVPEAIFNLGRLYEAKADVSKAIEQYEILVAEYQSYNLSSLAKSRLLTIK